MLNTLLMVISGIFCIAIVIGKYNKSKAQKPLDVDDDYKSIDDVLEAVKLEMVEIIKEDYRTDLSTADFNAAHKRKARVQSALKNCVYGVDSAKVIVIELIRSFLVENIVNKPNFGMAKIDELLGLSEGQSPSDHVKYEILMYAFKKRINPDTGQPYGKDAMAAWINKYHFAEERTVFGTKDLAYYIGVQDLQMTYDAEDIHLTDEEKIDILAILVYQLYKGFGIIDTMREMNVNGFNLGTSGSIMTNITKHKEGMMYATNAVWLYYSGKYIHLRFMDYGSQDELKRIIQLLIRFNNPGPLTAKRGYLVNTMYDKSRILALRPPASEYWAVFVRKFSLSDVSPEALILKPYVTNGTYAIKLIEFLMRGQITCAVTGRQGSGKTTLMSSIIRYIDPRYTIRVLEMAPELYLREIYTTRNILSVQETTTVTAAELQDALKKSDAAVSIVGEVATDVIAARMIQMGMTASLFTIFSHHANTPRDLVLTLRNSLVNTGGFSNMEIAERQVTEVVKCDIHLDYLPDGKRYIERISEIIPLAESVPYPEIKKDDLEYSTLEIRKEFYERSTDRISFWVHDILRYNTDTDTYYPCDRFSPALESKIRLNLSEEMRETYDRFMWKVWGPRKQKEFEDDVDEVEIAMKEYDRYDKEHKDKVEKSLEVQNNIQEVKDVSSGEKLNEDDITDMGVLFDFFDGEVSV